MRTIATTALLLGITGLVGCGGGETTDPANLPALTEQDYEEIRLRDQEVEDEEKGLIFMGDG